MTRRRTRGGIHYRVDGRGDDPVLLLCNSLGTDLSMWEPQVEPLKSTRRVVRFDLRGHGMSMTPSGDYTLDELGQDAEEVLDALDVTRADVCGESLGGVVALWLAVHRPHRVRRVMLANTAARIGSVEGWMERIAAVRSGGMAAIIDTVLERFFSADFRRRHADVVSRFRVMLEATDERGYAACCAALRDADLREVVARVAAPVLVIAGAEDVATPPVDSEWLHDNLGDSRLEVLAAAHLSSVERPTEFTDLVHGFLS